MQTNLYRGLHGITNFLFDCTRKPRLNPQLVAQQVAQQLTASNPKPKSDGSKERKSQINSTGNSEEKVKKKKIRNM